MCGIVGYVGRREGGQRVHELLLEGLSKLEYRGYDSAGISVIASERIETVRAVGNLSALRGKLAQPGGGDGGAVALAERAGGDATTGIGHTRWATHGRVSEANAHPHFDTANRVHVAVNGIVENYLELKERLSDMGAIFTSETDAEVIAHLIAHHGARGSLVEAVRAAYAELRGHYAFVVMSADEPGLLVGARRECPLVVGRGEGEQFIASAIPGFLSETRQVQYLGEDELVAVRPEGVQFVAANGAPGEHETAEVDWDQTTAEKQGFETYMLKEIYEQDNAISDTLAERVVLAEGVDLGDTGAVDDDFLTRLRRIVIVACGTAYHAGLVGRYAIEEWARVPVDVEIASEYRYRNPVLGPDDLVIGISQSGETADTLAAMRAGRERGARVLTVTNIMGSQATREADGVLYTRAGLEIGVAASKTFTSQVVLMYLLALKLGMVRGTIDATRAEVLPAQVRALHDLPRRTARGRCG